jgi:hypothetical protein
VRLVLNPALHTIDLSVAVSALTAFGGVTGVVAILRLVIVDRLISKLDASTQNIILRCLNAVVNFVAIVLISVVLYGIPFDASLLYSAALVTPGAGLASHFLYAGLQLYLARRYGVPAPDVKTESDPPTPSSTSSSDAASDASVTEPAAATA